MRGDPPGEPDGTVYNVRKRHGLRIFLSLADMLDAPNVSLPHALVHHVALAPAVGKTLQPDVVPGDVRRGVKLEEGQVIEHAGG